MNESAEVLKKRLVDFARKASMEISPHDEKHLADIVGALDPGTVVYIAHTPKASVRDLAEFACGVQAAGLNACPHIVARRISSEDELRGALERLRAGGCSRLLLVAGDPGEHAGPFVNTLDVLATDILAKSGFNHIGVAGHPQGNKGLDPDILWNALVTKQAYARRTGAKVHVVTQFGFDVPGIIEWSRELRTRGIDLPVHVGFAGPAPLDKLVRYAMMCGIGTSLKAAVSNTNLISNLTKAVRAADQLLLSLLQTSTEADRAVLVQPHFFAFGGSIATARWLQAMRAGSFDIRRDGAGFDVTT